MKNRAVIVLLIVLSTISFIAGNWYQKGRISGDSNHSVRRVLYYIDPMNPAIRSDKPGVAPCGMALEPVYEDSQSAGLRGAGMPPGAIQVSPGKQQLIGVKTTVVEKAPCTNLIRVYGRVVPDETRIYQITSATDGWMKKIYPFTTGSLVGKNELLATFYAPEFYSGMKAYLYGLRSMDRFQADVNETSDQLELTNSNIENYRNSLRNLGMTDHQLNEIMRSRKGADYIEIRSPSAGFILARNVTSGQRFEKGTEFYRIADLSHIWILADMAGDDQEYFRPGIMARVTLPERKKDFFARVTNVLPQFDTTSRTLKVRLEADNPEFLMKPDMYVDVELPVRLPPAIAVPVDAVIFSGLKKTVYIDQGNGFFEPREVETGWCFGDRVEIVSGLSEGEHIVVSGNFLIDSESRMRTSAADAKKTLRKDPVCGREVDEAKSRHEGRTSIYKGMMYYFCSDGCKEHFDRNPGRFLPEKENLTRIFQAVMTEQKIRVMRDPVCGMDVDVKKAEKEGWVSDFHGAKYHFCTRECKQRFERGPGNFLNGPEEKTMNRPVTADMGHD